MSQPADDPLATYRNEHQGEKHVLGTSSGAPIGDILNSLTIGSRGPILLQDGILMDTLAHFGRERIPERAVHAKGAGALGYFECTHDITKYTKAVPFAQLGKKTDVRVRLSTVGLEKGSADTVRDPRGFAVKFYTEEGNWDILGLNAPMFFLRDPLIFPSLVHTQKRNPRTNLRDANAVWDFQSLRPETTHTFLFVFSDRGSPNGYRRMDAFAIHAFKMVNADNNAVYAKFIFKTNQGIDNLLDEKATQLAGQDPDYATRDLFNAIETKNVPSWTLYIQVMTYQQAEKCPFNPFDPTKVWPYGDYPRIEVGKLVLNQNPRNYFAEVEQVAFSPLNLIPGIEPSPDKILQGRLFIYSDTQSHRLGPNFTLLPTNKPRCPFRNYEVDGLMRFDDNNGDMPNYFPNSYGGPQPDMKFLEHRELRTGDVYRHDSSDEDNYSQCTVFYSKVLDKDAKKRLASNIAASLSHANEEIRARTVKNFAKVHQDLAKDIVAFMEKMGIKTKLK